MIEHVSRRYFWALLVVPLVNFGIFSAVGQGTNGIFADFTTSRGKFTCWLDYTNAPMTVGNFITLATGERSWMDWQNGQLRTNPFYDGLIFHRVITNFMIQTGSPNGQGTDGPGFVIFDEFSSKLRHNKWGTLSMANSGPHSGGSQFFITATNSTSWLDDQHAVFGWVTSGSNVVYSISRVATYPTNNRPRTDVIITNINIRRVGTAASNFNAMAQPLPIMQRVPTTMTKNGQQVSIEFTNWPYAHNRLFESDAVTNRYWTSKDLSVDIAAPLLNSVTADPTGSARFFSLTRAQYPSSTGAPRGLTGYTLTLNYTDGISIHETNRLSFTSSTNGTYLSSSAGAGNITYYDWYQDIYKGWVWPLMGEGFYAMTTSLVFTNATAGTLSGTVYYYYPDIPWYGIEGTFTLSGP